MKRINLTLFTALMAAILLSVPTASRVMAAESTGMEKMVTTAKSADDHNAVAGMYEKEAAAAKEKAEMLRRVAASYRHDSIMGHSRAADYALRLAQYYDKVAKMDDDLAGEHTKMAKTM